MAQIEQSDKGGKKKKGAQKKMPIHVDFTPMVDMNMLLITFFMLCTTMLKPQTLKIALPTNDKVSDAQKNQAAESQALTLLLDVERDANGNPVKDADGNIKTVIYYYEGALKTDDNGDPYKEQLIKTEFLGNVPGNNGDVIKRGIREVLYKRNKKIVDKVDSLKVEWRNKNLGKTEKENNDEFDRQARVIRNDETLKYPIVMIKSTPEAPWYSVVSALDEISIGQVSHYQLENLNNQERKMLGLPVEPEASGVDASAGE